MVHLLVDFGMSLASLCFVLGYWQRKRMSLHRILMSSGVWLVLLTAVVMLAAIYLVYDGDRAAAGFVDAAPPLVILAHRLLATVALLLMVAMLFTGITRRRKLHLNLQRWFIPIYSIVYISGLIIFRNF